jgi:hypothetical protein
VLAQAQLGGPQAGLVVALLAGGFAVQTGPPRSPADRKLPPTPRADPFRHSDDSSAHVARHPV